MSYNSVRSVTTVKTSEEVKPDHPLHMTLYCPLCDSRVDSVHTFPIIAEQFVTCKNGHRLPLGLAPSDVSQTPEEFQEVLDAYTLKREVRKYGEVAPAKIQKRILHWEKLMYGLITVPGLLFIVLTTYYYLFTDVAVFAVNMNGLLSVALFSSLYIFTLQMLKGGHVFKAFVPIPDDAPVSVFECKRNWRYLELGARNTQ